MIISNNQSWCMIAIFYVVLIKYASLWASCRILCTQLGIRIRHWGVNSVLVPSLDEMDVYIFPCSDYHSLHICCFFFLSLLPLIHKDSQNYTPNLFFLKKAQCIKSQEQYVHWQTRRTKMYCGFCYMLQFSCHQSNHSRFGSRPGQLNALLLQSETLDILLK